MKGASSLATGIGLGVGALYLLDPDSGARRRALIRDKAMHALHELGDAADTTARDARNRAAGMLARVRSTWSADGASPGVLENRVRAKLGRAVSHPRAIEVHADLDGRVVLQGPVLAHEEKGLLHVVRSVRGVHEVVDRLEAHETPDGVPSLQGGAAATGARPDFLQENWAPTTRALAVIGGLGLLLSGLRRGNVLGAVAGVVGAGLAARGATNLPLRRLVGTVAGKPAVDIQGSRAGSPLG